MKYLGTVTLLVATIALFVAPVHLTAAGTDTLIVYASSPTTLDSLVRIDRAGGVVNHHVYKLVSTDTTYLFDATITTDKDITLIGVPKAGTGALPCIQPDVLLDNSIPGLLLAQTGNGTKVTLKNLYLLGIAVNNNINYGGGQAVQISGDSVRFVADNVVFEQWSQFAIGYSGNWDKFFVTNCKFRNMTTLPNQWYVGEVLRNENYLGKFPTDSIVMRYNTMLCVSGYAACPVTVKLVKYFEFNHNSVVYTFKNPFFIFNVTDAKINNNIFYGAWAGGISKQEYPWWDQLWSPEVGSIIDLDALDSAKIADWKPALPPKTTAIDTAAEQLRTIQLKNNVYFWPAALTSFWTTWNDTAHTDSIYTATWMNARTTNMFTDHVTWPGLVQSGNQNVDPGYGASIPAVLPATTGDGVGLLNWFRAVRTGAGTTETYGYQLTHVGSAANWVPTWPLPEVADMKYTNASLQTGGLDGRASGDPYWFNGPNGGVTGVENQPEVLPTQFALSANYPNPFNPSTNLRISLSHQGAVSLKIYNILGQVVATIIDGRVMSAGTFEQSVNLSRMSSGIYIAVLEQGENRAMQKLMLVK